jgi:hypothetical protein
MIKHYFDLDKVSSITLKLEAESEYKWYDEIKPQPKINFFGIQYGMTEAIPAGWGYEDSHWRYGTSYFDDYKQYRVDLLTKKVFIRPRVTVFLGHKDYYVSYFDTDYQAQAYVDELIIKSTKNFQVIIEK